MKFTPRSYQRRGVEFMANTPRCNVWADPGLGKTSMVLNLVDILKFAGSRFLPALVLAPKAVAQGIWTAEQAKWDHLGDLRVVTMVGTASQRTAALRSKADVYVMNYDNVQWLRDQLRKERWPFPTVVADEATRLKGFRLTGGGRRALALSQIAKYTGRWINLTGTPTPNGLIDLWGQCWFLDGGRRLGLTYTDFKHRWFDENEYSRKIVAKPNAMEEIHALLDDVTLNLFASDYFDLPPVIANEIRVPIPAKAMQLHQQMEASLRSAVDLGELTPANAADRTMKCLQIANGAIFEAGSGSPWRKIHDSKIEALRSLHEELYGQPLLVCYHFTHDLERLKAAFPGATVRKGPADDDRWNDGKIPMMFVHPQSAGHGINLQYGGNNIAFFGHWWDLEQYQQVLERMGPTRQVQAGLDRPLMVHHIIADGTLDDTVVFARDAKATVQEALRMRFNKC